VDETLGTGNQESRAPGLRFSRRTWCAAIAAVGLSATPLRAQERLVSLAELTRRANAILAVRPASLTAAWESVFGARRIVTTFQAEVIDSLLGEPPSRAVAIRELGGRVGEWVQRVSHAATLTLGQPSLVFLLQAPESASPSYWVLGMNQGSYPLLERTGQGLKVSTYAEQTPWLSHPESAAASLAGLELERVRAEIARLRSC
jgi:hypothetical protein